MKLEHSGNGPKVVSFGFEPGQVLARKYIVEDLLGRGWEGEVYKVIERGTRVHRAAKVFFPHRNKGDTAMRFYARKLERLRSCPILIQYHSSERIEIDEVRATMLVSDYVEGELLDHFVARHPGKRLPSFQALVLLHALARGLEDIHTQREYHGDMHSGNVIVRRQGIRFILKLVDMYHWGRPSRANIQEDVINLVRIFYDVLGGKRHYAKQPVEIRQIVCGLKRGMIAKRFPTAHHLRRHLEQFEWDL